MTLERRDLPLLEKKRERAKVEREKESVRRPPTFCLFPAQVSIYDNLIVLVVYFQKILLTPTLYL